MRDLQEIRERFLQPGAEYSMLPFWFINGRLDKAELMRQIADFKEKGVDGFVFHPRLGLTKDTPYLSDRYLDFVRFAVEQAASRDMTVVLYDEAMYPSGSAHGKVVAGNPEYAARAIRLDTLDYHAGQTFCPTMAEGEELVLAAAVRRCMDGSLDLGTAIPLQADPQGHLAADQPIDEGWQLTVVIAGYSGGTIRGVHFGEDDGEVDAPKAADLLNPAAVQKFIRVTHESYYRVLKEFFGTTVQAFFTDEPSLLGRCVDEKALRPWSLGFLDWYKQQGNEPLDLLALWLDVGPETAVKQRRFRQAVNKRLEQSYYAQLHDWCEQHGIALTGHPAGSDDIGCLRYFQIPGQDVVWRWVAPENDLGTTTVHSTMAKCASDAARHLGRRRNGNECFGCCGPVGHPWDFAVDDMKWYFDWLFVRGTNLLYPHAFLYSVEGEVRYNERPPDVGPNNSWWPYHGQIADYVKRMSWLNTDSVNGTALAVLGEEDHLPWQVVRPLYTHQIAFNYLEDRLLTDAVAVEHGTLRIAAQCYRVLLIEDPGMVDASILPVLKQFAAGGGHILLGSWLTQNRGPEELHSIAIALQSEEELLHCLERLSVREAGLQPAAQDIRLAHQQKDGVEFYLLTNEGEETYRGELLLPQAGQVECWDAWTGSCQSLLAEPADGGLMKLPVCLPRRASRIYVMIRQEKPVYRSEPVVWRQESMPVENQWSRSSPDGSLVELPFLTDWTREAGLEDYYGMITYRAHLLLPACQAGSRYWLDFGRVGEIAELRIDGRCIGTAMWAPYAIDITGQLGETEKMVTVEVRVTSSFSRRYTNRSRPAGLMGPVRILREYCITAVH